MMNETLRLLPDPDGYACATRLLRAGKPVAIPTETVYGLAGDARDSNAVAALYQVKGRPAFNPLIVHLPSVQAAEKIAVLNESAYEMAARFWPGPLTMVLPLRPCAGISDLVTAGLDTVAIRVPADPVARAILQIFDGPLAAPSANPSGRISPTTADHVFDGLNGRIAAVLDGGPCTVGVESTIVSLDPPALLRPGGVPGEALQEALGQTLPTGGDAARPNAPGQLKSHYAPGAKVRLNAAGPRDGEVWIGFGPGCAAADLSLSDHGNTTEAATRLFATLRAADALATARGAKTISVCPIPDSGLGLAINDRLMRAAAPRNA